MAASRCRSRKFDKFNQPLRHSKRPQSESLRLQSRRQYRCERPRNQCSRLTEQRRKGGRAPSRAVLASNSRVSHSRDRDNLVSHRTITQTDRELRTTNSLGNLSIGLRSVEVQLSQARCNQITGPQIGLGRSRTLPRQTIVQRTVREFSRMQANQMSGQMLSQRLDRLIVR
jgi:hypothetical protein